MSLQHSLSAEYQVVRRMGAYYHPLVYAHMHARSMTRTNSRTSSFNNAKTTKPARLLQRVSLHSDPRVLIAHRSSQVHPCSIVTHAHHLDSSRIANPRSKTPSNDQRIHHRSPSKSTISMRLPSPAGPRSSSATNSRIARLDRSSCTQPTIRSPTSPTRRS